MMKALNLLQENELKSLEQNILHLLETDIAERTFKRHFDIDLGNNLIEECARYDCKKLGIQDETQAVTLTLKRTLTGTRAFLDPRIFANLFSYLGFGIGSALLLIDYFPGLLLLFSTGLMKIGTLLPYYEPLSGKIGASILTKPPDGVNAFSHEIGHLLHYNYGRFRDKKERKSKMFKIELEGLASCLGVDALVDSGFIDKARKYDGDLLIDGYLYFAKRLGMSRDTIEERVKESKVNKDNIKEVLKKTRQGIALDGFFRPYSIGYSIINAISLNHGEESVYHDVFQEGLEPYLFNR